MEPAAHPGPSVLVLFGAAGDLSWRKIAPALYNMFLEGLNVQISGSGWLLTGTGPSMGFSGSQLVE